MEVDLKSLVDGWEGPLKVISNLPYYITTPIVMKPLENDPKWDAMVFMVQKEVAQRMAATPGTKDYSSLSVAVKYYSDPKIAFTVSRNCFIPKPDVDSAVVKLVKRELPWAGEIDKSFFIESCEGVLWPEKKNLVKLSGWPALDFTGGKDTVRTALLET